MQALHKVVKAPGRERLEGHAAMGQLLQQATCRVLLIGKKTLVHQCQTQQGGLQPADELTHRLQQTHILRHVFHHQRHHFQAQCLGNVTCAAAQQQALTLHTVLRQARLSGACLATLLQTLHHPLHLLHLVQRFECRRYGVGKIRCRTFCRAARVIKLLRKLRCELIHSLAVLLRHQGAREQAVQPVQGQQCLLLARRPT